MITKALVNNSVTTLTIKKILYTTILLLGSFSSLAQASLMNPVLTFPSLPTHELEAKFSAVQQGFEERSNLFLKGRHFQNWTANKDQKEIFDEFKRIEEWRNHSWYAEDTGELLVSRIDFMIAQDLLAKGYYRYPNLIAFQYNQTDGSYNSSTIMLNGQRFLALEAPNANNLQQFNKLLQNFRVAQLVRLTSTNSNASQESKAGESAPYPYWQGRIKQDSKTKGQMIQIPLAGINKTFPIHYYFTNASQNNEDITVTNLIKLIQAVRKDNAPDNGTNSVENGLIACHCDNGVGKTGTFIAGYALLQEIDRQIAAGIKVENLDISIEKIVMQLSLQKVYMVSNPKQYLTLYRLVDTYIQSLNGKKN